jgi:ribosomal protein S18 acetylase RimI-like enzyme
MFGPVGTHQSYRRRGLAKALMSAGLKRLQALGANRAYVDCDPEGAANRLYEAVGFSDCAQIHYWQKMISM